MTRLTPRQRIAAPIRLIAIACMLVAVLLAGGEAMRHGFAAVPQSLILIGTCAVISGVLIVDARRQLQCELTETGFAAQMWDFRPTLPFVGTVRREFIWADVVGIGREGYSLLLKTQMRTVRINLFLFEEPEAVAKFALDMWRAA